MAGELEDETGDRFHVWAQIEREREGEEYEDVGEPEKLGTFDTLDEANTFVAGLVAPPQIVADILELQVQSMDEEYTDLDAVWDVLVRGYKELTGRDLDADARAELERREVER